MGGSEEGRKGGRGLMHSVPVGFGSGSGLFFALDGLLEALVWVVWLVWSGLVWFGCTLVCRRSCYSFCFCLVVCSFRAVCCIQYTVLVLSCLCAFDVNLRWETLN